MLLSELRKRTMLRPAMPTRQPDEGLIVDQRSTLKPAEQVDIKLYALLQDHADAQSGGQSYLRRLAR